MAIGITVVVAGSIARSYIPGIPGNVAMIRVAFAQNGGTSFSSTGIAGSGVLKQEPRNVRDFSSASISGVGTVHLRQANAFNVVLGIDDNLLSHYETSVKNGVLILGFKSDTNVRNLKALNICIDMPELNGISLSGAAAVVLETTCTIRKLLADIFGTGKINGTLKAHALTINASGATAVTLAGQTDTIFT